MADVFLSYAREDSARAQQIAEALEQTGVEVFWDNEIPPGTTWADYIEQKLAQCKALIVLWSEHSTKSQWVREEARMGRDKGVLIPVMIDTSTPPFGFGEVQAANLSGWNGEVDNPNWRRFADAVQRFAKNDAPTPAPMPSPPREATPMPAAPRTVMPPRDYNNPSSQPAQAKRSVPVWAWVAGAVVATVAVIAVISSLMQKPQGQQTAETAQPVQQAVSQQPAQTPPAGDESPQAIILGQLQQAQAALAQQGFQMIGQPYSGGLQQGQTWNVPAQLSTGIEYRVVGVCDRDCNDLDLVLFDGNGQPLVQDRSTTSQPVLGIQPSYTGPYTLQVQMYNCSVAPCYYAVALWGRQM
jgi:hypothetical protein